MKLSALGTLFLISCFASLLPAEGLASRQWKNDLEPLFKNHKGEVGFAVRNLTTGEHFEYNADKPMPTASLIKLPLMVCAYRLVDQEKLDLSKSVELHQEDKVPGSGVLTDHFSAGISLPLVDYIRLMIRYSDNTATNGVANQIGLATTAETMASLGYPNTKLHSLVYRGDTSIFPERSSQYGIGSTTAAEMVALLSKLEQGELASEESTKAMRTHLLACEDSTKLAADFPTQTKFAHKTGAIANCRTDAGILYTAKGPVALCLLTNKNEDQSWKEDNKAHVLAGKVGRLVLDRYGTPAGEKRLREGSFGKLVESLQRTLNDRLSPSPNLAIDGDFGPATRGAVERFQRVNNLEESGIVTAETWQALGTLIEQDDLVPPPDVVNSEKLSTSPQPALDSPPIVTCKAWAVADFDTGELLFSANANEQRQAASTTKIMTCYVVLQLAKQRPEILDEIVCFSARADNTVGSTSGVRAGEQLTVRELIFGLMLPSGNDASVALAEHVGERLPADDSNSNNYDRFITEMNRVAGSLGMAGSTYKNPHGLPDGEHVVTAHDLLKLASAAMQDERFRKIVSTRQFGCTVTSEQGYQRNVIWKNTNQLLSIDGYSGVKTGTTKAAGACLVSCGERAGDRLLAVVLGASSSPARYADTRNLFRWVWKQRIANHANDKR